MKRHELRQPLIQSAVVLVVIFFLIAFVAGSDANGFFGGITSIFKGVFFTLLFTIALTIAVIISIAFLLAIFFGAVALYSPDSSKEMFFKFRQNFSALISSWSCCCKDESSCIPDKTCETVPGEMKSLSQNDSEPRETEIPDVEKDDASGHHDHEDIKVYVASEIDAVGKEITLLQQQNVNLGTSLEELNLIVSENPAGEIIEMTNHFESQQNEISSNLSTVLEKLNKLESDLSLQTQASSTFNDRLDTLQNQLTSTTNDLIKLQQAAVAPIEKHIDDATETAAVEESHRIFSYLDKEKDRELLANLVEDALSKNMTYAEIDIFLSKGFSKKNDAILKEHPTLTKDYIRDCKRTR